MMPPLNLSEAIVQFLGYGSAFSPQRNRLDIDNAPHTFAIESILRKLRSLSIDWDGHSLISAGAMARSVMASEFPNLSETALNALEWKFTFDWR